MIKQIYYGCRKIKEQEYINGYFIYDGLFVPDEEFAIYITKP